MPTSFPEILGQLLCYPPSAQRARLPPRPPAAARRRAAPALTAQLCPAVPICRAQLCRSAVPRCACPAVPVLLGPPAHFHVRSQNAVLFFNLHCDLYFMLPAIKILHALTKHTISGVTSLMQLMALVKAEIPFYSNCQIWI